MGEFKRIFRSCNSHTPSIMAELGLKKKEIEAIEFAFDVYDFKGDGNVDAFYVGDLMRACNINPTLKTIKEIGGTEVKRHLQRKRRNMMKKKKRRRKRKKRRSKLVPHTTSVYADIPILVPKQFQA